MVKVRSTVLEDDALFRWKMQFYIELYKLMLESELIAEPD